MIIEPVRIEHTQADLEVSHSMAQCEILLCWCCINLLKKYQEASFIAVVIRVGYLFSVVMLEEFTASASLCFTRQGRLSASAYYTGMAGGTGNLV